MVFVINRVLKFNPKRGIFFIKSVVQGCATQVKEFLKVQENGINR